MQQKAKKILSIFALLGIGLGFLPSAFAIQDSQSSHVNLSAQAPVKIIVSEIVQTATITASSSSRPTTEKLSCMGGQYLEKTLIQDQVLVNLNQPANCFSLSPAELVQNQTRLSVQPLVQFQTRIVVLPNARIMSNYYQSSTNTFPQSAANVTFPVGLAVFAISAFGIITIKRRKIFFTHIRQSLSLEQLQVMRC